MWDPSGRESLAGAVLHPVLADFTHPLTLPPLDGLVMANSLHFVRKKAPLLTRLASLLKPGGRLIIVEYNASRGSFAVPYPLDEAGFLTLAREAGLRRARVVAKIPSTFLREMYAGLAFRNTADCDGVATIPRDLRTGRGERKWGRNEKRKPTVHTRRTG